MIMHNFASFHSAAAARLFADYCQSQGFNVVVSQQGQTTQLAAPAEQLPAIEPLLAEFLAEPDHGRYQAAAWQQSNTFNTASSGGAIPFHRLWQAPVTFSVILLVLAVYLWQQLDFRAANSALMLTHINELWRWVTPMLLHFSVTHLVFNLCWWFLLGQKVEQHDGSILLLQLALSSAIFSNGLQFSLVGADFGGLSGVVYALFGYCWLKDKLAKRQDYQVSDALAGFMLIWLVLGFMDVLWVNMANWAHLGGLLAGLIWAALSKKTAPV